MSEGRRARRSAFSGKRISEVADILPDQFAGLCWRRTGGRLEYVLVTSQRTGRWIFPKGRAEAGEEGGEAAAREAREEAGVEGRPGPAPLGRYRTWKITGDDAQLLTVELWPVAVDGLLDAYDDAELRRRCVAGRDRALALLDQSDMRALLIRFDMGSVVRGKQ